MKDLQNAPSRSRTYNLQRQGASIRMPDSGATESATVANSPACASAFRQNGSRGATKVQPAEMGRILRLLIERVDSTTGAFLRDLARAKP